MEIRRTVNIGVEIVKIELTFVDKPKIYIRAIAADEDGKTYYSGETKIIHMKDPFFVYQHLWLEH